MIFKINRDKLVTRAVKYSRVDRRRFKPIEWRFNQNQPEPSTGLTTFTTPKATVWVSFNGEPRSKHEEHGIKVNTWNHYETQFAVVHHELTHVKDGNVSNGEYLALKATRKALIRHRCTWMGVAAFLMKP